MSERELADARSKGSVGGLIPKEHVRNLGVMEMFILIGFVVNECIHLLKLNGTEGLSDCMENYANFKRPYFQDQILCFSLKMLFGTICHTHNFRYAISCNLHKTHPDTHYYHLKDEEMELKSIK